jgi:outer membrane protein assembly factor BamE (lipoprotein component of BamABCDE complex)
MRPGKRSAIGLLALGLLLVGGLAFGKGFIEDSALLDEIKIGATTAKEVAEILGPPGGVSKFERRGVEAWDYQMLEDFSKRKVGVSIEIDGGGIVRNIQRVVEYGP